MSTYENGIYGLAIMLLFTLIITVGFIYELGSGALLLVIGKFILIIIHAVQPPI